MGKRHVSVSLLVFTLILVLTSIFSLKGIHAWSNGGYSADPSNPDYGTHDWIAQHALEWLPKEEKQYISNNLAAYLYGTELPDNGEAPDGIGDTTKHHVYYNSSEVMTDDAAAARASAEYNNTLIFLKAKDYANAAKNAGIMSHYIADMAVFGHVMGASTDWGTEVHHSDYEEYLKERTLSYSGGEFDSYLSFDVSLSTISAYDAAKDLAFDTTFDVDGDLNCTWMDQNYDWDNSTFKNRTGESLNLAVNYVADVLNTLWLDAALTVDDDGLADFHTIQAAINAANPEDIIFVLNGTYVENVVINKTVSLIGESKNATIVKSAGSLSIFEVKSDFVLIENFGVQDGFFGIYVANSKGNNISNNNVISCSGRGLYLEFSDNNIIEKNTVHNNEAGISLAWSSNNSLQYNEFYENAFNFAVGGTEISHFIQKVDVSNTVDGKPIYYWVNEKNKQVPSDAGIAVIVNSTGITVRDFVLRKNMAGVLFAYTNNSLVENVAASKNLDGISLLYSHNNRIQNNIATECDDGIYLRQSNNNTLNGNSLINNSYGIYSGWYSLRNAFNSNTISNNRWGIYLGYSQENVFYHNNLVNNEEQISSGSFSFSDRWDNGYPSGGNYWNDYTGIDEKNGPNQDQSGSDGVGDTPYIIDQNNRDRYPLVNPWPSEVTRPITILSLSGLPGNNGWYTSDVVATLSAFDTISGVDKIQYSFDNATWASYMTPFTVTGEGNTVVYYNSTDKVGNQETTRTKMIKIDKTIPSGSISVNNGASHTTSTYVTLTLISADATSGVFQVRFSNDDVWDTELWETPSSTKTWALPFRDGTNTVYYQIKDNAGLTSTYSDSIILDTTQPTANAGNDQTSNVGATVTFDASDSTDNLGIASYEWNFGDGSSGTGETTTHAYTQAGTYNVTLTVKDSASNTSTDTLTVTVSELTEAFPMSAVGIAAFVMAMIAVGVIVIRKRKT